MHAKKELRHEYPAMHLDRTSLVNNPYTHVSWQESDEISSGCPRLWWWRSIIYNDFTKEDVFEFYHIKVGQFQLGQMDPVAFIPSKVCTSLQVLDSRSGKFFDMKNVSSSKDICGIVWCSGHWTPGQQFRLSQGHFVLVLGKTLIITHTKLYVLESLITVQYTFITCISVSQQSTEEKSGFNCCL